MLLFAFSIWPLQLCLVDGESPFDVLLSTSSICYSIFIVLLLLALYLINLLIQNPKQGYPRSFSRLTVCL